MDLKDAKALVGKDAVVTWIDRKGEELTRTVQVYEAGFVPLYGPCLMTDLGNISLDRIRALKPAPRVA